jgi:asparagine synthetase B (glutamine-hydrolysing)
VTDVCGILGIHRDHAAYGDETAWRAACAAMAWRGPDGTREARAGRWRIAVARLAITDPAAPQPIVCPATGRAIAFNGAVTSAAGEWSRYPDAVSRNDAELPLLRLRHRGPEALTDMTGPYAFAIVDPTAECLWLAQDPMGEKPLWAVLQRGRVVAFASTPASLRALGFDVRTSGAGLAQLLRLGFSTAAPACPGAEVRTDWRGAWRCDGRRAAPPPTSRSVSLCPEGSTAARWPCCSASAAPGGGRTSSAPAASPRASARRRARSPRPRTWSCARSMGAASCCASCRA